MSTKARRRPNPARTQRAMARDAEALGDRRHQAWLATLTPEHRAIHERNGLCHECIANTLSRPGRALRGEAQA